MTFEEWWNINRVSLDNLCGYELAKKAYKAGQPKWQDISTAPKDGSEIILCVLDSVFVGVWIGKENYRGEIGWHDVADSFELWYSERPVTPTHWMPLPEPPKDD